jgi:hypothetical protein
MGTLLSLQNTVRSFGGLVSDKLGLHSKAQVEVNFAQKEVREKVVEVWNKNNPRMKISVGKDNQLYLTSSKMPVKFYANSNELTGLLTKKPNGTRNGNFSLCKSAGDDQTTLEKRVEAIVGRLTRTEQSPEEAPKSWCTKLDHALFGTPEERAAKDAEAAERRQRTEDAVNGW